MKKRSGISEQLKQILSDRGLTATELGRMAGVRTSFIYDVLSGKSKNPSIVTLSKIANALAVPLSELSGNEKKNVASATSSKLSQSYVTVPMLTADAPAKDGSDVNSETLLHIDHFLFRRSWIKNTLNSSPEELRLLSVTGDSMEPTLNHGDVVLVDTSKTTPSPPGIFVLYDGLGVVVKRIDILPGSKPVVLSIKSDNDQYSPYERNMDDTQILGRVVWFAREF